jgi:hypothetical protein
MIKNNARTAIAQALGEGELRRCDVEGCGHRLSTSKSVRDHFTKAQAGNTIQGWEAKMIQLRHGRESCDVREAG